MANTVAAIKATAPTLAGTTGASAYAEIGARPVKIQSSERSMPGACHRARERKRRGTKAPRTCRNNEIFTASIFSRGTLDLCSLLIGRGSVLSAISCCTLPSVARRRPSQALRFVGRGSGAGCSQRQIRRAWLNALPDPVSLALMLKVAEEALLLEFADKLTPRFVRSLDPAAVRRAHQRCIGPPELSVLRPSGAKQWRA